MNETKALFNNAERSQCSFNSFRTLFIVLLHPKWHWRRVELTWKHKRGNMWTGSLALSISGWFHTARGSIPFVFWAQILQRTRRFFPRSGGNEKGVRNEGRRKGRAIIRPANEVRLLCKARIREINIGKRVNGKWRLKARQNGPSFGREKGIIFVP